MRLSGAAERDRDSILRATAGALLGALPLLYTMEMWWYGRTSGEGVLLAGLGATLVILALALLFGGFRRGERERLLLDVPIVLGVAVVAATATLLAVGQIRLGATSFGAAARMVATETPPCALGAALALTQLRPPVQTTLRRRRTTAVRCSPHPFLPALRRSTVMLHGAGSVAAS